MPFTTVFFILGMNVIIFAFIAWNVKSRNDLRREELRAASLGGSQSLGTSELKGLIQEAMVHAIAPLEDRLEKIEAGLRQLPAGAPAEKTADEATSDSAEEG